MRTVKALATLLLTFSIAGAAEKSPSPSAERGRKLMLEHCFVPALATSSAYNNLWKNWGLKKKPDDFLKRIQERYGLFEAPFPNKGLPMGLKEAKSLFGKGVAQDCLMCHAGRVAGQTIIGLGNASIDLDLFYDELNKGNLIRFPKPFTLSHVRGTIEATAAAEFVLSYRDRDLNVRTPPKREFPKYTCEDVPAWWLMKHKKTKYLIGSHPVEAVRPLMTFMMTPIYSGKHIKKHEPMFRDIQAFLLSLKAPKYPFKIDKQKAALGQKVFEKTCARCHGTYGEDRSYPNKIVKLDVIGTDPALGEASAKVDLKEWNENWLAQEVGSDGKKLKASYKGGYQAPPLDGVWATSPYLHNASVPTVYHLLKSSARPRIFTRSYQAEKKDYDPKHLGVKFRELKAGEVKKLTPVQLRGVYDTTKPARSNAGHTFGDKLSEKERMAVIEYLKTL